MMNYIIDVILDFSQIKGKVITLLTEENNESTNQVMQFRVVLPLKCKDTSEIPKILNPDQHLNHNMVKN